MSLKALITATYRSGIYTNTAKLQKVYCKAATEKNQLTFLNRCIYHKILPRFLQIKCPYPSQRIRNLTEDHKKKLLIATRNDTKARFLINQSKHILTFDNMTSNQNRNDPIAMSNVTSNDMHN